MIRKGAGNSNSINETARKRVLYVHYASNLIKFSRARAVPFSGHFNWLSLQPSSYHKMPPGNIYLGAIHSQAELRCESINNQVNFQCFSPGEEARQRGMRTECGANLKSGLHSYPRCVTPNLFNRELYKAKHMFGHLFVIIYGIHMNLFFLEFISKQQSIHMLYHKAT